MISLFRRLVEAVELIGTLMGNILAALLADGWPVASWDGETAIPEAPRPLSVAEKYGFGQYPGSRIVQLTEDEMIMTQAGVDGLQRLILVNHEVSGRGVKFSKGQYFQVKEHAYAAAEEATEAWEIIGTPGSVEWLGYYIGEHATRKIDS